MQRTVDFYKSLPFIAKVERDGWRIHLTSKKGRTKGMEIIPKEGEWKPPDQAEVARRIEEARSDYEARLKKGDTFFFLGYMQLGFGSAGPKRPDLGKIVAVLESNDSDAAKRDALTKLRFWAPQADKEMAPLLHNFQGSPQLHARLAALQARPTTAPSGQP